MSVCVGHRIKLLSIASTEEISYHPGLWIRHLISVEKHSTHQISVEKHCFTESSLKDLDAQRDPR